MRCNSGIPPRVLADQHLIAEYRELPMVLGSLRINGFKLKSEPRLIFGLGKGHINWYKTRLLYLKNRHNDVIDEMKNRGFKCDGVKFDINEAPTEFHNNWQPTLQDSMIIRQRIKEKLLLKPKFYKYNRNNINDIDKFINDIFESELWPN